MSHGVNKSCITSLSMQLPKAATRLRSFEIHKTQLDVAGKSSAFFFFESATACWLWETWTWWPHLASFRLDVLIVVFSGSDSFSQIWSHGETEREREREGGEGGGEGQRLNRTYRWRELRFQLHAQRHACRGEIRETRT